MTGTFCCCISVLVSMISWLFGAVSYSANTKTAVVLGITSQLLTMIALCFDAGEAFALQMLSIVDPPSETNNDTEMISEDDGILRKMQIELHSIKAAVECMEAMITDGSKGKE